MSTFKTGDLVPLAGNNSTVRILNYIAEGGQGEVYKVEYQGREYALKWYSKMQPSDAFYENLKHNIQIGAPKQYFLWPIAITEKIRGKIQQHNKETGAGKSESGA